MRWFRGFWLFESKEEGRGKKEEGRRKREEGRRKREEGRGMKELVSILYET
ncbi:MAG: hypothetical protein ABI180_01380 [Microcoleus sp.]|jgi:hypothetical protein